MQTISRPETRVFIVDDSAPIRERLVSLLDRIEGVSVAGEAESPFEAIQGIVDTRPDSVVLDAHLRNGSGIDVLRGVACQMAGVVFIVLTNHPSPQYRKAYLNAGASHFLDKNAEFEKVAEIISALGTAHCH